MLGLDTNVLLRWLIDESMWPDDSPGQTKLVSDLILDNTQTFFVNHIVMAEMIWVLANPMKQSKPVLLDILDRLLSSANVIVDQRGLVMAALAGFRRGPPGFTDHLIGLINRKAGCDTTVSFDKGTRRSDAYRLLRPHKL